MQELAKVPDIAAQIGAEIKTDEEETQRVEDIDKEKAAKKKPKRLRRKHRIIRRLRRTRQPQKQPLRWPEARDGARVLQSGRPAQHLKSLHQRGK